MPPKETISPSFVPELVVVGELNVDLILDQVNALPELGKERLACGMTLTLGSSSAILASNASALGVAVGFIGCVGKDTFGKYVIDRLQSRHVDTRQVIEMEDAATGLTAIYTHRNDRGMMTYPGAMERLRIENIPWDYLLRARHLHLSSFYLQRGLRPDCVTLFRKAKEAGLSTSLDTNWDPDENWGCDVLDVLKYVDIFLPNDDEARWISGENDLDRALKKLAQHAGTVVITCGAEGVRARRREECFSLPTYPVVPVDAVGAGDSFNAGFLYRFLRGGPLSDCLHFGLLTGAFSTLAPGGTTAFEDISEFIRFARVHGVSFVAHGETAYEPAGLVAERGKADTICME